MTDFYDESQVLDAPSGMGENSPVPKDVNGFNWGVFFLPLFWGIANKVKIVIIICLCCFIPIVNFIIAFLSLPISVYFGLQGNKWAWQSKNWPSIEKFHKTQRAWAAWGLALFLIFAVGSIISIISTIMLGVQAGASTMKQLECAIHQTTLQSAYQGRSFDNKEDLLKVAGEGYKNQSANSGSATRAIVLKDSIRYGNYTIRFFSHGVCDIGLNNCGAAVIKKDTVDSPEKIACKFYIENGGNIIPKE